MEAGINVWLQTHTVDTNKFTFISPSELNNPAPAQTQPSPINQQSNIQIKLDNPQNGTFVVQPLNITAQISSQLPLEKIEVYLNNNLIDSQYNNLGNNYTYTAQLNNLTLNQQNLLVIRATDSSGNYSDQQVIVFTK